MHTFSWLWRFNLWFRTRQAKPRSKKCVPWLWPFNLWLSTRLAALQQVRREALDEALRLKNVSCFHDPLSKINELYVKSAGFAKSKMIK